MSGLPYINPMNIADEYRVGKSSSSRPRGMVRGSLNKEIVGSDGRNDWFRGECRDCGKIHITVRNEKSSRFYQCAACGTWHHINRGFFNRDRFDTVPLTNDEYAEQLYRVRLSYTPSEYDEDGEWHYGTRTDLQDKIDTPETWTVVKQLEEVE